jgi:RNA polymerase sigma-70 factor (ECF subfamily)
MEKDNPAAVKAISDPATWVDQHGDYLYRNALARVREPGIAEDVVQETFLAALKARHSFAGKSTERTWLVGILKRKIVDYYRKISRETNLDKVDHMLSTADDNFETSGGMAGMWKTEQQPAEWMIDSSDAAEQTEFWNFLQKCLDKLPPRLAVMFVLREMEEINSEEICNILRLTPTNLRVMLYRARKELRGCLEKKWIGEKKIK